MCKLHLPAAIEKQQHIYHIFKKIIDCLEGPTFSESPGTSEQMRAHENVKVTKRHGILHLENAKKERSLERAGGLQKSHLLRPV